MPATIERCANATKYKAILRPHCNHGNPCKACIASWYARHPAECALAEKDVIVFALMVDDHYDLRTALQAWREGDWKLMHEILHDDD